MLWRITQRSRARYVGRVRRDGEPGDDWSHHAPGFCHRRANRVYRQRCRDELRAGAEPHPRPKTHPSAHAISWWW